MKLLTFALVFGSVLLPAVAANAADDDVVAAVRPVLPKLEAYAGRLIENDEVPGLAVAVVAGDEIVFAKGFGSRLQGGAEPVDAETVFQVASLSKAISSTIVAGIVGTGAVSWDSRLADIDPAFRLSDPYATAQVTVADLFAHRSGLPGNAGNELEALGYGRDDILKRLRLVAPAYSFRGGYSYSNFGLTAGAVAAAGAAGLTFEDAARQMLFEPLDMSSASVRHADFLRHRNRAELHVRSDGRWRPLSRRQPDAQAPAGGVSANIVDLAKWLRLVLAGGSHDGRQIIAEEAMARSHVPVTARGTHPITGLASFYALGWNVSYGPQGVVWGHAGAFSNGARSVVRIYPEQDVGIVIVANAFPTGVPEAVADTFADLLFERPSDGDWLAQWNGLYQSMFGPAVAQAQQQFAAPPDPPSPGLAAGAYAGTYANAYIGNAVVTETAGRLVLELGPDGQSSFALHHFDRDLFVYYPYDEMPDEPYALTFRIGPDGRATEVLIDDLNELGWGVLAKKP